MNNEVKHRAEMFVEKPQNTLFDEKKNSVFLDRTSKTQPVSGKSATVKMKGWNIFVEWTDPDSRRLL